MCVHIRTYVVCVCVRVGGGCSAQNLRPVAPVPLSTKPFLKEE